MAGTSWTTWTPNRPRQSWMCRTPRCNLRGCVKENAFQVLAGNRRELPCCPGGSQTGVRASLLVRTHSPTRSHVRRRAPTRSSFPSHHVTGRTFFGRRKRQRCTRGSTRGALHVRAALGGTARNSTPRCSKRCGGSLVPQLFALCSCVFETGAPCRPMRSKDKATAQGPQQKRMPRVALCSIS